MRTKGLALKGGDGCQRACLCLFKHSFLKAVVVREPLILVMHIITWWHYTNLILKQQCSSCWWKHWNRHSFFRSFFTSTPATTGSEKSRENTGPTPSGSWYIMISHSHPTTFQMIGSRVTFFFVSLLQHQVKPVLRLKFEAVGMSVYGRGRSLCMGPNRVVLLHECNVQTLGAYQGQTSRTCKKGNSEDDISDIGHLQMGH